MPKLSHISGREAVCAFQKAGWEVARQRGSHMVLTKPGSIYTLSVPLHDELGPGLLRSLLHKAGLTVEEFRELL
ncbi:MAG: type II toxin-antitoxin system HicA family toxin [Chloroflexi bacterium]|nr:type II toxin-antitoxin system HicA family toxin [Chloroflexota bacterium]